MSTVAAAWPFTSPAGANGSPPGVACTASWDGNITLTDTVTATGQVVAKFSGQCFAGLTAPLPDFATGSPSAATASLAGDPA